jgi:hypothetical protein
MKKHQQKIIPTAMAAEYRHPKTGKVSRYPLIEIKNGAEGNQVAHLLQMPDGSFAREHEVPEQFVRYVSNEDTSE